MVPGDTQNYEISLKNYVNNENISETTMKYYLTLEEDSNNSFPLEIQAIYDISDSNNIEEIDYNSTYGYGPIELNKTTIHEKNIRIVLKWNEENNNVIYKNSLYKFKVKLASHEKYILEDESSNITINSKDYTSLIPTLIENPEKNIYIFTIENPNSYDVMYKIKDEENILDANYLVTTNGEVSGNYAKVTANTTSTVRVEFTRKAEQKYPNATIDTLDANKAKYIVTNLKLDVEKPYNDNEIQIPLATNKRIYIIDIPGILNTVKIGDFVQYTPVAETTSNGKYDFEALYTGYSDVQEVNTHTDLTWRVLNKNTTDGTIDLISGKSVDSIYLCGVAGYNNGVYLLNDMCETLYGNASINATARSINILDFKNKLSQIGLAKIENYKQELSNGEYTDIYGSTENYSNFKYYPLQWYNDTQDTDTDVDKISSKKRNLIPGTTQSIAYDISSSDLTITANYWALNINNNLSDEDFKTETEFTDNAGTNIYRQLLFQGDQFDALNSWVASRCVRNTSDTTNYTKYAAFGLYYFSGGNWMVNSSLNKGNGMLSINDSNSFARSVRPIITIPAEYIDTEEEQEELILHPNLSDTSYTKTMYAWKLEQ